MSKLRKTLGLVAASLLATAVVALPATAEGPTGFKPADLRATDPATPQPAPGETAHPAPGSAAEDDMPTSEAQRASALGHLRHVAACVRGEGLSIPDPVSDADGVHLAWSGGFRPDVERAIARCDAAVGGRAAPIR